MSPTDATQQPEATALRVPVARRRLDENARLLGECPLRQAAAAQNLNITFGYPEARDDDSAAEYQVSDGLAKMIGYIDYHHRWADVAAPLPADVAILIDPATKTAELEAGPEVLEFLHDQNRWLQSYTTAAAA